MLVRARGMGKLYSPRDWRRHVQEILPASAFVHASRRKHYSKTLAATSCLHTHRVAGGAHFIEWVGVVEWTIAAGHPDQYGGAEHRRRCAGVWRRRQCELQQCLSARPWHQRMVERRRG